MFWSSCVHSALYCIYEGTKVDVVQIFYFLRTFSIKCRAYVNAVSEDVYVQHVGEIRWSRIRGSKRVASNAESGMDCLLPELRACKTVISFHSSTRRPLELLRPPLDLGGKSAFWVLRFIAQIAGMLSIRSLEILLKIEISTYTTAYPKITLLAIRCDLRAPINILGRGRLYHSVPL